MSQRPPYRTLLAAGATLAVLAVALAACGGGGGKGTPTPFSLGGGSQVQGFTPTPTAAPLKVTPAGPTPTRAPAGATPTPTTGAPPPSTGGALQIAAVGNELRFDADQLSAKAGAQVRLLFKNSATSAALQHNWVLVKAGTEDAVANAGLSAGPGSGWIPLRDPNVIAHTALVDGGKSGEVTFTAPVAGTYAFICTFPGHAPTMRGVFQVTS